MSVEPEVAVSELQLWNHILVCCYAIQVKDNWKINVWSVLFFNSVTWSGDCGPLLHTGTTCAIVIRCLCGAVCQQSCGKRITRNLSEEAGPVWWSIYSSAGWIWRNALDCGVLYKCSGHRWAISSQLFRKNTLSCQFLFNYRFQGSCTVYPTVWCVLHEQGQWCIDVLIFCPTCGDAALAGVRGKIRLMCNRCRKMRGAHWRHRTEENELWSVLFVLTWPLPCQSWRNDSSMPEARCGFMHLMWWYLQSVCVSEWVCRCSLCFGTVKKTHLQGCWMSRHVEGKVLLQQRYT